MPWIFKRALNSSALPSSSQASRESMTKAAGSGATSPLTCLIPTFGYVPCGSRTNAPHEDQSTMVSSPLCSKTTDSKRRPRRWYSVKSSLCHRPGSFAVGGHLVPGCSPQE